MSLVCISLVDRRHARIATDSRAVVTDTGAVHEASKIALVPHARMAVTARGSLHFSFFFEQLVRIISPPGLDVEMACSPDLLAEAVANSWDYSITVTRGRTMEARNSIYLVGWIAREQSFGAWQVEAVEGAVESCTRITRVIAPGVSDAPTAPQIGSSDAAMINVARLQVFGPTGSGPRTHPGLGGRLILTDLWWQGGFAASMRDVGEILPALGA